MKGSEGKCELCGGSYASKGEKEMGGTKYKVLKCEKCNRQVIRRAEQ